MNKFFKRTKELLSTENSFSAAMTALVLAVVTVVNLLAYVIVSNYGLYLYTARQSDVSLSGATDAIFSDVGEDERVTIIFCQSRDEVMAHDTGSYVHKTAVDLAEKHDFIDVEYVNIFTEMSKVKKYVTDDEGNVVNKLYPTSVIFTSGERHRVVTDVYTSAGYSDFFTLDSGMRTTSYNGEEVMAAMITRVLSDKPERTVYFTLYHGETSDVAFYNLMICAGYNVATIDLRTTDIPSDAEMLVISNPVNDFERAKAGSGITTELERVERYLEGGGTVYVALDPIAKRLPELEYTLEKYGISLSATEAGGTSVRNMIRDGVSSLTADGFTIAVDYADSAIANSVKSRVESFGGSIILADAAALTLDPESEATPLLVASPSSELYAGDTRVGTGGRYCVAATAPVRGEDASGRVVVVSSVYLTAADALVANGYSNKDFFYSMLDEITDAQRLPYNCEPVLYDTETLQNLMMGTARIYTAFLMAIPAAIAVVGAVVIIRRKNR